MDQSSNNSPIHWSAAEIARRIARREISAVEVAQAFISRINAVNPAIHALVVERFEQALAEARGADQCLARGNPAGPLHGVPITLKECFHLAGTPATMGLPSFRGELIPADGILVSRLRRAGAIVLGKTNVSQLMIFFEADNPLYGRTNNPWDLARTCGGSTGGEGAIIAARGSPLGLGNDLGGSIRVPCHFCGIHGFKPTSRRLPRQGARRALRGFDGMITQAGPMARFVEDLEIGLRALADNPGGEIIEDVIPASLPDPARVQLKQLKIATWSDNGVFPPAPGVARAVREAAAALRQQGVEVVELSPAIVRTLFRTDEAFDLYCRLVGSDGAADARLLTRGNPLDWRVKRLMWLAGLRRPARAAVLTGLRLAGQQWPARLVSNARPRSAVQYWHLADQRSRLAADCLSDVSKAGYDAFVCPPYALAAPPHKVAFDLLAAASYSMLFNLLGWPAGTLSISKIRPGEDAPRPSSADLVIRQARRAEHGSAGLPIGVQVAALPWREDVALAVMRTLEAAFQDRADYPGRTLVPVPQPAPTRAAELTSGRA